MTGPVLAIVAPMAMTAAVGLWLWRDVRRWPVHAANAINHTAAKERTP